MEQIIKAEDLIGKEILKTKYHYSGFLIIFTDNTFCIIEGEGEDSEYASIKNYKTDLTPNSYNYDTLVFLGILTEEDVKNIKEEEQKKRKEFAESKKYAAYLALKEEYENPKKT